MKSTGWSDLINIYSVFAQADRVLLAIITVELFLASLILLIPTGSYGDTCDTFIALSLFAKLLMIESDSWKRELPVNATSEISWLTAMMIWNQK